MKSEVLLSLLSIVFVALLTTCGSSSVDDGGMGTMPTLSITTLEFNEGDDALRTVDLVFQLSAVSDKVISFNYSTADKSALEGEDYQEATGSISFAAGETSKTASLNLLPDEFLEFDEQLILKLENVTNATVIANEVRLTIRDDDSFVPEEDADGFITPDTYPSMDLIWSDEFGGSELNEADWSYELGDGCPNLCGWGNNELETYTRENTSLVEGKLVITAGSNYASSRLITKGKQEFQYGRIDIRAKLPQGQGIWPALWMLGANIDQVGWPVCGEIDIMEAIGNEPFRVHGTAHYNNNGHQFSGTSYSIPVSETFSDKFHIFSIIWQENSIKWLVDYQQFFSVSASGIGGTYPFNNSFFFIANLAIGGNWPGNPDTTTVFPQTLQVDYIRVFRSANL